MHASGTPLENYIEEIGLINIFLNNADSFNELINLSEQDKREKAKHKKDILNAIFDKGYDDSIENDVIFHFSKLKKDIERNARIFSVPICLVPIDERMYNDAESNYVNFSPKQRRFLSHPASVLKNTDKKQLPRCIKAEAVKSILFEMKNYGLSDISLIIYSNRLETFREVKNDISQYYPKVEIELCLTEIFQIVCEFSKTTEDHNNFDSILRQKTMISAHKVCQELISSVNRNAIIHKRLDYLLSNNETLYKYNSPFGLLHFQNTPFRSGSLPIEDSW